MMFRIVSVIVTIILCANLGTLFTIGRVRGSVSNAEMSLRMRRVLPTAIAGVAMSGFVLFCLFTKVFEPLEALIGLIIVGVIQFSILASTRLPSFTVPVIARDADTGQILGEIIAEYRSSNGGRIESFKIRTQDGNIIQRPSDRIIVGSGNFPGS